MKKKRSLIKVFITGILLSLIFPATANAETKAYITGDIVYFRTGAGTNFNSYTSLNKGDEVLLNSSNKINGPGCPAGWYSVKYTNKNGYVCSTYVSLSKPSTTTETYLPWTSPKKAIMGGAQFIASGYIAEGQNTSYLKKFNVNPQNSNTYKHQYMANLAAPYNEALTSYRSYKENNLLSMALHFVIPVYVNMPEYTTHPVTGKENGGTSTIKDQAFEEKLNAQKFDETYKKWLRALHETYPNWTFEAMHTNLDFNTAVENEKWASSINKVSCSKCIDPSNINTEGTWYVASTQTTAYFLDPRNFLMADSILMFEDLSYNSYYTEAMVKSILANTFMAGNDTIDKMAYSKMFMEAGQKFNVSPIYLASLSRQEVGTKIGLVTSGEKFEYKGSTYVGFYNFFNIGAYSSEENPAKAGLVYASKGAIQNQNGVYVGNLNSSTTNEKPVTGNSSNETNNNQTTNNPTPEPSEEEKRIQDTANKIIQLGLNIKENYLTNLSVNQTVGGIMNKVANQVSVKTASGKQVAANQRIGTGMNIDFKNGLSIEVVLYGDLTGDGLINSADLLKMRQYLLGKTNLSGSYLEAARLINVKGNINSADLLRLRQYLLGQKGISQL